MTFRYRLQYFLCKALKISNKQAIDLIASGQVFINAKATLANVPIHETDQIIYQNQLLQQAKQYKYYKLYKPRGIECTLNPDIEDNLLKYLPEPQLFVVGRLDKDSEGLLLLSNNGKIFDKTLRPEQNTEKEYKVWLDKPITTTFLAQMASGVKIMGSYTKACQIWQISEDSFGIILTEGRNRQIRRMCYKLGYQVRQLQRLRIGKITLGPLKSGEYQLIDDFEV